MKLVMLTNTPTTNTILLNYHLMNIFQLRLGQLVLCWVFLFHLFQKRWVFLGPGLSATQPLGQSTERNI